MRAEWRHFFVAAVIPALVVLGMQATASEPLRVYAPKNISAEVDNLAKAFNTRNPQNSAFVTGGVPELGITGFAAGNQDLLICPRGQLDPTKLPTGSGFQLAQTPLGEYGLAIVVSPSLTIGEMTLTDIRNVFTGAYKNWAQLGGPNEPIKVFVREPKSGATFFMKTKILEGANFTDTATELSRDTEILSQISQSTGSVGYVRVNRLSGTNAKSVSLKKDAGSPGVTPSGDNIKNGSYPLTVVLTAYWNGLSDKTASILAFVNFCKESDLGLK